MASEVQTISLPRTEDLIAWCVWLVPVISLLLWDVWKAWKRRALWIPGHALVLSALIIQLLSFIDYSHISIYSGSSYKTEEVVAVLVKNQLVIDSGRLMMCVLMVYLVPGMACSGSTTVWANLTALGLSIILKIVSDLYSFNLETKGPDRKWSIVFDFTLFIAIIYLLMLLIHAAMIGRSIRKMLSQRIPLALSCCDPFEKRECNDVKDHAIKCWIVVRASQPDYVLARSQLTGFGGLTVTVCVVISIIKWRCVRLTDHGSVIPAKKRTLTQFVIVGQLAIVLIGCIIIFIRYLNYWLCGQIRNSDYLSVLSTENVYNDLQRCLARLLFRNKRVREKFIREKRPVIMEKFIRYSGIVSLSRHLVHCWQKATVPLSKHYAQFSKFLSSILAKIMFSEPSVSTSKLSAILANIKSSEPVAEDPKFSKYKEALEMILFPGEKAYPLWIANIWGLRKLENYMGQGHEDGKRSPDELIRLIRHKTGTTEGEAGTSADEEKAHLRQANKNSWKRTAVSLIHLMIYFYDASDKSDSDSIVIENAIQSYIQTWEYMNFVDSLNGEVKSLGRGADKEFDSLQNGWNKRKQNSKQFQVELKELIEKMENPSDREQCNPQNSRDGTEAAKICLFETRRVIHDYAPNAINKINHLQCLLANVIFCHMTEDVNKAGIGKCSNLAEEGKEEKIVDVAFLLAKARGVLDKVNEGHNQVDDTELTGNDDQGWINSTIETEIEEVRKGNNRGHYNGEHAGSLHNV